MPSADAELGARVSGGSGRCSLVREIQRPPISRLFPFSSPIILRRVRDDLLIRGRSCFRVARFIVGLLLLYRRHRGAT